MPEVAADEDDEGQVLGKLKPKIPDHKDAHPIAEDMRIRKDAGLRQWRSLIPMLSGGELLWTAGFTLRNSKTSMRQSCLTRSLLSVT